MIEIKKAKKKSKKKREPYYHLVFNYMIGDANGYTSEEVEANVDNPYVERFVKLLNSLQPTKGRWGVILEEARLRDSLNEGQITEDDYNFLCPMMFYDWEEENELEEDPDDGFKYEFMDCVRDEAEYSFLVFEGIDLYYYDEYGVKHETKIK